MTSTTNLTWKDAVVTTLKSAGLALHYIETTRRIIDGQLVATSGRTPERTVSRILTNELMPAKEVTRIAPGTYAHTSILDVNIGPGETEDEFDGPDEIGAQGHWESAGRMVTVNRYERDHSARLACIEHYGHKCVVCSFNFEERYGSIGIDYIHVHHLVPLSSVGATYNVNPIEDLRPICPNCHAMVHRRQPPYSVEEIRTMLTGE